MSFHRDPAMDHLNNHETTNKYCYCKDFREQAGQCLICRELAQGHDYRTPNAHALDTFRVAVTGSNGKTTVTNLLGRVLASVGGNQVGFASTTGIYRGQKQVFTYEHRASEHYTYLMNQPEITTVVAEQPEAGLAKYGLPLDHHVGIVTNLVSDHLERPWVHSGLDDVFLIKSLIVRMALEQAIVSIDYEWSRRMVAVFDRGQCAVFGRDAAHVAAARAAGYHVTTVENGQIVIYTPDERVELGQVNEFLVTLRGILTHNIENLLPVLSALHQNERTAPRFDEYLSVLKAMPPSFELNPARFNVLRYQDSLIVFDYAHNEDGYRASLSALQQLCRRLGGKRSVGLVAAAADRSAETVRAIAEVIGNSLDDAYVRTIPGNANSQRLADGLPKASQGRMWDQGYRAFIEAHARPDTIVYVTIAGHGHIQDLATVVTELGLTDIAHEHLEELS
ncbi:hypothetical protein HY374_03700 [Candidatus Berkelbacteria bacterium]|nr:hypothetical protein [Candidatus Berkelbacteria bacterium]